MGEYEIMLDAIRQAKPDITQAELDERIRQKKEKVGAGYLTDRGAIFLVAADLGVALERRADAEVDLKDVPADAKEVSVCARVMNISPVRQFTTKDGSQGSLRTMTVYGKDARMSVKLWGEKATADEVVNVKPGDLVRIIKAYVKNDLDGRPAMNIGSGSSIEIPESQETDIPPVESLAVDIGTVGEGEKSLVVSGKVSGAITSSEFTTKDGRVGKMLRMAVSGKDGAQVRVVIWGRDTSDIPSSVPDGAAVQLIGVDGKQGNSGVEVHGNEATIIKVDGTDEMKPLTARIVSRARLASGAGAMVLGLGADGGLAFISDEQNKTAAYAEGDVIECMPTSAFGSSVTLGADSFVRKVDAGKVPPAEAARTEIGDIKAGAACCIKAIVLKVDDRRDIQTRSGETVALAEMYVEDNSGPVWVKGWRAQADLLAGCSAGEIYEITALNARPGLEGRVELFLTPYSVLRRLDS